MAKNNNGKLINTMYNNKKGGLVDVLCKNGREREKWGLVSKYNSQLWLVAAFVWTCWERWELLVWVIRTSRRLSVAWQQNLGTIFSLLLKCITQRLVATTILCWRADYYLLTIYYVACNCIIRAIRYERQYCITNHVLQGFAGPLLQSDLTTPLNWTLLTIQYCLLYFIS